METISRRPHRGIFQEEPTLGLDIMQGESDSILLGDLAHIRSYDLKVTGFWREPSETQSLDAAKTQASEVDPET